MIRVGEYEDMGQKERIWSLFEDYIYEKEGPMVGYDPRLNFWSFLLRFELERHLFSAFSAFLRDLYIVKDKLDLGNYSDFSDKTDRLRDR